MTGVRRTYMRRLMRGMGLLLGVTVLSLAFGESILRLCPASVLPAGLQQRLHAEPHDVGRSHPSIGVLEQPFQTGVFTGPDFKAVYHTDGHGFRNPSPWPPEADVVVLGDAVAFGYGVEDAQAWPALLAQWLAPQRVLNLGLIDAGPQQYLHVYETFESALRPRVVLVGLSLANDFEDAELFDGWWRTDGRENYRVWKAFAQMSLAHPLDTLYTLLGRYSYLFHMVGSSGARVTHFRCLDGGWLHLFPDQLEAASAKAQPDQSAFHLVLRALQRLQALAQEQGAYILVVFQPSKEETYLPLLGNAVPDLQHTLQEALAQHGIAMLDLTPVFRHQATVGARLFFTVDGSPNAQGHLLIARSVLRHLTGQAPTDSLSSWEQGALQGDRERE
jgi:SGNH hydrolase-like domain, acetyltransferase AlgX